MPELLLYDIQPNFIYTNVPVSIALVNDTTEEKLLESVPTYINLARTQIVLSNNANNTDRLITRTDIGPIIIIDDGESVSNYLEDLKTWEIPATTLSTTVDDNNRDNGCVNFILNPPSSGAEHYLFFYRQGEEAYRIQRLRQREGILKIGLKLFTNRVDYRHYTGSLEMKVVGVASDHIINGHSLLSKLLA